MGNVLSKEYYYKSNLDRNYFHKRQKIEHKQTDKIRSFRMQEEYGAKKFIKP
tara:strand:+ start:1935 stop:2090 length:156 start_codon:yes stop_codon:yes gene_type:complete